MHPASTSSPSEDEFIVLKGKRSKRAGPVDPRRQDEVETLKAKSERRDAASAGAPAKDELAILKAKRGKLAAPVDVERADEVETLKAKLAGNAAATKGKTTTRNAPAAKAVERGARPRTLPREAAGVASVRAKRHLLGDPADPRRRSAFDLAFVLVLGLWGIVLTLALTTGMQLWLFFLCSAATAAVLLFGLFDSSASGQESGQK